MKPRFLLDEHLGRAIQRQLRRRDARIEILLVGDPNASVRGLLDPDLLLWLEATGYILVTSDESTIPGHLIDHYNQGRHLPGVFWIRDGASLGQIIEALFIIWEASEAEEYVDRLLHIPF